MYLYAYRRRLPHFRAPGKTYFVTLRAAHRKALPEAARDIALECCVYEHEKSCWLDSVVIMPNHGHLIIAPYDEWPLQKIMERWNASRLTASRKRVVSARCGSGSRSITCCGRTRACGRRANTFVRIRFALGSSVIRMNGDGCGGLGWKGREKRRRVARRCDR